MRLGDKVFGWQVTKMLTKEKKESFYKKKIYGNNVHM